MAMQRIRVGTNEDGSPHYLYRGENVVFTGTQTSGVVTLEDGSEVDITEPFVEANDLEHAEAIATAIDKQFLGTETPAESAPETEA